MSKHVTGRLLLLFSGFSAAGSLVAASAQEHMFGGSPPANSAPSSAMPSAPMPIEPAPEPYTRPWSMPKSFHMPASVVYSTTPGKISYYLSSAVSVRVLAEAVAVAGIPNITASPSQPQLSSYANDPNEAQDYQDAMDIYGDQMNTWRQTNDIVLRYHAYRFETGLATSETRQVLSNLALPLALHQQARYIPAAVDAGFGERMWNAASSLVVTRNDSGFTVPNYSKLVGTVGAAFLGKAVYANTFNAPELDSNHFVLHYVGYSLLGDLATNMGHELVRAAIEPDLTLYSLHGAAADDSYYPMSLGGKIVNWARSAYSIRNFASAAFMAGVPQVTNQPIEPQPGDLETPAEATAYDNAYQNWGTAELAWKQQLETQLRYREHAFVGGFSESETQMLLQNLIVPVGFDMDPRYLPLGPGHDVAARMGHALRGLVVTHMDSGRSTVNVPVLGGTVGAAFLAKDVYYPALGTTTLETSSVLTKTISLNLAADAVGNMYHEFFSHRAF